MAVQCSFPEKHQFLFERHPYKILHSGRLGMKSWSAATAALLIGADMAPMNPLIKIDPPWPRAVRFHCVRETMEAIAASVHQLLEDKIAELELKDFYEVQKRLILGKLKPKRDCPACRGTGKVGGIGGDCNCLERTQFTFGGIRHDVASMKSMEGCDVLIVEEAEAVSAESWKVVTPTIREQDSEIWVLFNPKLATDPTYVKWVLNPPRGAVVVKTTYLDNPWIPQKNLHEAEDLRRSDPVEYANIWLGECRNAVEGAIYGKEIKQAEAEGRICRVPWDRTRPVDTFWDLGWEDHLAIWFAQAQAGWYNILDYIEDQHLTIADYVVRLQSRGYIYGTDYLPHDGVDSITHAKLVGFENRNMSPEQLLRKVGRKVRIMQKLHVATQINAARTIFPQCRFDREKCQDGLTALRHYAWGTPKPDGILKREPLHNRASHGSSAFMNLAISIRQPKEEKQAEAEPYRVRVADI